ncbi:OmpA family protein [Candidatus Sumerlaeota bacterium]|nr:OmpA family protein [Candidatus Sumerlaeota bacterium]
MAKKVKKRFVDQIVVDPFTVQFCALSVILLAFFILLNTMATIDQEKMRVVIGSLIGTFGRMPGGETESPDDGMLNSVNFSLTTEDRDELTERLASLMPDETRQGGIDVEIRDEDLVFILQGDALFEEGEDTLIEEAAPILSDIVQMLGQSGCLITIEGHTDRESAYRTSFETPWWFAAARAARVYDDFLDRGISHSRMTVASLGAVRPQSADETEQQHAFNRRVEIVVHEGAHEPAFRSPTQMVDVGGFTFVVPAEPIETAEVSGEVE